MSNFNRKLLFLSQFKAIYAYKPIVQKIGNNEEQLSNNQYVIQNPLKRIHRYQTDFN